MNEGLERYEVLISREVQGERLQDWFTVMAERADLTPGGELVFYVGKRAIRIFARGSWIEVVWRE